MNWLDPVGAALSLICTYYFTHAHRFAWLIGIAAIIINGTLYWLKGIYGSVVLEAIYFISMIFGFFHWGKSKNSRPTRPIRYLRWQEFFILTTISCITISIGTYILSHWTDSDIPFWDATTTILSLVAQGLLCWKIMQCWILWFIVDALVAALQFYKGIPFHSATHAMYLFLAILGYYRWQKLYQKQFICASPQIVGDFAK